MGLRIRDIFGTENVELDLSINKQKNQWISSSHMVECMPLFV